MSEDEFDHDHSYNVVGLGRRRRYRSRRSDLGASSDEYGDEDDGSGGGDEDSSSDGEGPSFVRGGSGRRNRGLKRATYTTFGNDGDGAGGDVGVDGGDGRVRRQRNEKGGRGNRRENGKDEAIYGVFLGSSSSDDDDDDDDDDDNGAGRRRRRRRSWGERGRKRPRSEKGMTKTSSSGPVAFVKSGKADGDNDNSATSVAAREKDAKGTNTSANVKTDDDNDDIEVDAESERSSWEADDAELRFRALLERGKKSKIRTTGGGGRSTTSTMTTEKTTTTVSAATATATAATTGATEADAAARRHVASSERADARATSAWSEGGAASASDAAAAAVWEDHDDEMIPAGAGLGFRPSSFAEKTEESEERSESSRPRLGTGLGFTTAPEKRGSDVDNNHDHSGRMGVISEEGSGRSAGLGLKMEMEMGPKAKRKGLEVSTTSANNGTFDAGLGFGNQPSSSSLPSSFAGTARPSVFAPAGSYKPKAKPATRRDPTIGTWEKHTKGIGMKLLTKMGYSGSGGLGAKRRKGTSVLDPSGMDDGAGESVSSTMIGVKVSTRGKEGQLHQQRKEEEVIERKGISRPVEVVVRPANLGLGYGNFAEATKLRSNRQIEAEVRGIDLKKQEKEEEEEKRRKKAEEENLLPGMGVLLGEATWRRGAATRTAKGRGKKRKKGERRRVVLYEEVIKEKEDGDEKGDGGYKIIDMRGPSADWSTAAAAAATDKDGKVPLGQELLYNLTLLVSSYEDRVRSASHYVRSYRRKVESLESDIASTRRQVEEMKEKATRLEKVQTIIDAVEKLNKEDADGDGGAEKAKDLILELCRTFTAEERRDLKFHAAVVPALLGPTAERSLDRWDPLKHGARAAENAVESVLRMCPDVSDESSLDGANNYSTKLETQRAVFRLHILPRIRRSFQSSGSWDPIQDVELGVDLHEAVLEAVRAVSPSKDDNKVGGIDEDVLLEDPYAELPLRGRDDLEKTAQDEIMYEVIFQRLSSSLRHWAPSSILDNSGSLRRNNMLHSWILPWLPHLDDKSMLDAILPEVKRKLRSALTFLSKERLSNGGIANGDFTGRNDARGQEDVAFARASVILLHPWQRILDSKSLHGLVSEVVVPRLGRYLSRISIVLPTHSSKIPSTRMESQDWVGVDLLFDLFGSGLVSQREFISLVEGEILAGLTSKMHSWLMKSVGSNGNGVAREVILMGAAESYLSWKKKLFCPPPTDDAAHLQPSMNPWEVVRNDSSVCCHMYAVLLMIKAFGEGDSDALDELAPPPREESNFRSALARRAREDRRMEEEEERRRATSSAKARNDGEAMSAAAAGARRAAAAAGTVTFREVVEDFARQNDVEFRPRAGPNSTKDGRPVFLFGTVPVYLDANVVYALRGSKWQPTHLEDLVLARV